MDYRVLAKRYFPHLRVLGDFSQSKYAKISKEERRRMPVNERKLLEEEEQRFFADSRQHGLDDSVYPFGIGGSDVAIIFSKGFKPPSWLYEHKRYYDTIYRYERPTEGEKKLFDTGHFAEPVIREIFERKTSLVTIEWPLQVVNPKYPHCIANIDGLVFENGKVGIYEGKWSNKPKMIGRVWRKMEKHLKRYNTFPPLSLVPDKYLLQVWFYLAVYELDFAYICGGWGYEDTEIGFTKIPRLPAEKEVELMKICEEFVLSTAAGIRPSDIDFADKKSLLEWYKQMHTAHPQKNGIVSFPKHAAKTAVSVMQLEDEVRDLKKLIDAEAEKVKHDLRIQYGLEQKEAALLSGRAYFSENMYDKSQGVIESDEGVFTILYEPKKGRRTFKKDICKEKYPAIFDEVYNARTYKEIQIIRKEA